MYNSTICIFRFIIMNKKKFFAKKKNFDVRIDLSYAGYA